MQMTESEICTRYRRAADPRKQVGILAQLNACPAKKIAAILAAHGTGVVKPMPRGSVAKLSPEQCAELLRLNREGVSQAEIGRRFGCDRRTAGRRIKALLACQKKGDA